MHTQYINFTEEQKQTDRQIDIAELPRSQGETLKRSGSEYEWRDGSAKVTIRGNLWFHQYERQGGDAIDFVRRFYNKSYPEAMEYLLSDSSGTLAVSPPIVREVKPFELPPKNENMRRAYAYLLNRRGIDKNVLNAFLDSEMEQVLCFDTAIDAEKFCNEKSAVFIVMPEENPNSFFMVSLLIQQLYREILAVADENGGKLPNRAMFYCDEFGSATRS